MSLINNVKSAFAQQSEPPLSKYGDTKDWFLSDAGKKMLDEIKPTVELVDYTYHYLKSLLTNKDSLSDDELYRSAFVLADSVVNSKQQYAGKANLLNACVHPFIAYFQNLQRSLSTKSLCYEMLFILFGVVNPFDATEWIYDSDRKGYSDEEYKKIAEDNGLDFSMLLKRDYPEEEDIRLIACEIVWVIGQDEFLQIVK